MSDSGEVFHVPRGKPVPSEVARIAARQFGVVSLPQLLACGLTHRQIECWVDRAHLHRIYRGVFAVGHRRLVDHAYLVAALLSTGPGAFLSHRSAAAVWGLRIVAVKAIEVTLPGASGRRREGLIVHRTASPHPTEVVTRNGLRVSSVPRLLVELAPRETQRELKRLITQAARKGVLDMAKVEDALARHARRPGIARLKEALAGYRPGDGDRKSNLEIDFDAAIEANPDIPPPVRNVTIDGWEIDCYWPDRKVAVELDGRPYHIALRDMDKDRFKDGKLLGMGISPLRITDRRFEHDQLGALNDLRVLLQRD